MTPEGPITEGERALLGWAIEAFFKDAHYGQPIVRDPLPHERSAPADALTPARIYSWCERWLDVHRGNVTHLYGDRLRHLFELHVQINGMRWPVFVDSLNQLGCRC